MTLDLPVMSRPARVRARTPFNWIKENLFNTWYNALLTLLALWLIAEAAAAVAGWALTRARWEVIPANFQSFLVGTYPRNQVWRVWAALDTLALLTGLSAGAFGKDGRRLVAYLTAPCVLFQAFDLSLHSRIFLLLTPALMWGGWAAGRRAGRLGRRLMLLGWFLSYPCVLFLLWGIEGLPPLPRVETTSWGGLTLTLLLAATGIVASFPLGVLLALGRRSSLPVISWGCAFLIEVVRGTPFVAVLFMAHLLLPLFLPQVRVDRVVRAMVGLSIFTAAYVAENVRGGLQGVPKGQYEAAMALGLSGTKAMLLVVLPQALRAVLPSIVGQFISLFKDTSLVVVLGLLDLLGIARSVLANPQWLGTHAEVYLFAAAVYWIFCYALSQASRRLETALGITKEASP